MEENPFYFRYVTYLGIPENWDPGPRGVTQTQKFRVGPKGVILGRDSTVEPYGGALRSDLRVGL